MNLRVKFTISVSILLLFFIFFVAYSIFTAQKRFLTSQFEENRDQSFKVFFHACEEALKSNDEEQLNSIINSIVSIHKPSIVYASFISGYQKIFVSRDDNINIASAFGDRLKRSYVARTERYESLTGENIYEYTSPIIYKDKYLGTLVVGFSQDYMESRIQAGTSVIYQKVKTVAIIAILLAIIVANFMAWRMSKPIGLLAQAAQKIGEGEMDVKVDVASGDEIGVLAKTFNEMAVKVKETDKLKDSFVSSVSHELRSPLAAIDGYCDLLIEGVNKNYPPEQQLRGLRIIKDASIRLTSFINNILDLAKIKAGKFEMKFVPIRIGDIITEISQLFESLARNQKKTLGYSVEENLPTVMGDVEKIKQLITNLLGNALKFTRENDGISVNAMVSKAYGSDFVEVWVADTGIGLAKGDLEKVFEKFYQVKEGEFKKPKGTGLGLSIVYEIIKLHNGRIWAESELGKGTVFKFVIPVAK
ncbi:MAG: HAMP domain-containing histidine kinase [Endomicrobia bacterium]|nr:HAMP domain-containing histidine kinase [Endomicrobiia bacterium]